MVPLSDLLRDKVIPWAVDNAAQRLIVARPRMRDSQMPAGVELTQCKIKGPRVIVKNRRYYGNIRGILALWPKDGLNEITHLKLVCVLSGRVNFQVGEYVIHCDAGHFILIPPGLPHPDDSRHNLPPGQEVSELLNVILHPRALQCWINRFKFDQKELEFHENFLFQNEHTTQLFRILMERGVENNTALLNQSAALLPVFFQILLDEIKQERYIHPGMLDEKEIATPDAAKFEEQLHQYINRHIGISLTIESVAREMFFSRAQFARRVRKETGKTFVEILTECRLQEAKVLLSRSEWTVNAIAEIVGYKVPAYFRRVFRRHTGMTPGEYRKMERKKMRR